MGSNRDPGPVSVFGDGHTQIRLSAAAESRFLYLEEEIMNIEISTLQEICDGLLIPDEELLNIKILNAAKRGIEWARKHPDTDVQIAQRVRLCRSIMRRFDCSPMDACMVLELSKVDRTPVLKILAAQDRQKKIVQK